MSSKKPLPVSSTLKSGPSTSKLIPSKPSTGLNPPPSKPSPPSSNTRSSSSTLSPAISIGTKSAESKQAIVNAYLYLIPDETPIPLPLNRDISLKTVQTLLATLLGKKFESLQAGDRLSIKEVFDILGQKTIVIHALFKPIPSLIDTSDPTVYLPALKAFLGKIISTDEQKKNFEQDVNSFKLWVPRMFDRVRRSEDALGLLDQLKGSYCMERYLTMINKMANENSKLDTPMTFHANGSVLVSNHIERAKIIKGAIPFSLSLHKAYRLGSFLILRRKEKQVHYDWVDFNRVVPTHKALAYRKINDDPLFIHKVYDLLSVVPSLSRVYTTNMSIYSNTWMHLNRLPSVTDVNIKKVRAEQSPGFLMYEIQEYETRDTARAKWISKDLANKNSSRFKQFETKESYVQRSSSSMHSILPEVEFELRTFSTRPKTPLSYTNYASQYCATLIPEEVKMETEKGRTQHMEGPEVQVETPSTTLKMTQLWNCVEEDQKMGLIGNLFKPIYSTSLTYESSWNCQLIDFTIPLLRSTKLKTVWQPYHQLHYLIGFISVPKAGWTDAYTSRLRLWISDVFITLLETFLESVLSTTTTSIKQDSLLSRFFKPATLLNLFKQILEACAIQKPFTDFTIPPSTTPHGIPFETLSAYRQFVMIQTI